MPSSAAPRQHPGALRAAVRPRLLALRWLLCLLAGLLAGLPAAHAATTVQTQNFSFTHTGSVSTGLVSVGGTFSNTVTTAPTALAIPRFDGTLGLLTQVTLTVTTTTSTFAIHNTGLLSLASQASASRTLAYGLTSGTLTTTDNNVVTTPSSALLTALASASTEIGGAPLAKTATFTAAADLTQFTGTGNLSVQMTSTNVLGVTAGVSALNGAGFAGTGTYTGSVTVTYLYTPAVTISGTVYRDANHNGLKDSTEAGTGLTLYAKLVPAATPAGPATRAVAVNTSTGVFTLTGVVPGAWRLLIDDNNTLSDVTPLVPPAGWTALEQATLARNISGLVTDLPQQNFGLAPFGTVSGRLFTDDGSGSGMANDGVVNGGEVGQPGLAVQLLDASSNVLDTATSAGDGSWRLFVPATTAAAAPLRVVPALPPLALATGAAVGSSAGSYTRATNTITYNYASAVTPAGLNFGSVPPPRLIGNLQQSGVPGASVTYRHRFIAGSTGVVTLSYAVAAAPALQVAGWNETVYLDANANGVIDNGEQPVTGTINVVAGQTVWLVTKVQIPAAAPFGARQQGTLRADMVYSGAAPALSGNATALQITDVVSVDSASMSLSKAVDRTSARPGDTLVYALTFTNIGNAAIHSVVVSDSTPAYTRFVSAAMGAAPATLGTPVAVLPAVGQAGVMQWTFPGPLAAGESATVTFTVTVEP